jgi:hypothetical protein
MDGRTDGRTDGQGDSYLPPKLCLRGVKKQSDNYALFKYDKKHTVLFLLLLLLLFKN